MMRGQRSSQCWNRWISSCESWEKDRSTHVFPGPPLEASAHHLKDEGDEEDEVRQRQARRNRERKVEASDLL